MPKTRSQTADDRTEKQLRVYEDFPASPSENAPTAIPRSIEPTEAPSMPATEGMPPRTAGAPAPGTRAPSVRSNVSASSAVARIRQAELAAEEQLAAIRRQELEIQSALIKKKLAADVATIREETDRESLCGEETDAERKVCDWLQRTQIRGERDLGETRMNRRPSPTRERMAERRPLITPNHVTFDKTRRSRSPTPTRSQDKGMERLANVLEKIARGRTPSKQTHELPIFSGTPGEWLPFKAAMRESSELFNYSPGENLARLRSCLRGEARQIVSALLYTASEPTEIMKTLEQCYGRPEIIIDHALEEIKKLPRLGLSANELNGFAIKLQNIVTVITCLDERGYLQNPMLARYVTEKLSPHIKSKWCDYAEENGSRDEPEIITISRFLMREADRAIRHSYSNMTTQPATVKNAAHYKESISRQNERRRAANVYVATETPTKGSSCFCCGENHATALCKKLAAMTVPGRWEWAKEARICFLCLNNKHRRFKCKAKKCGVDECRMLHHALLHSPRNREPETEPAREESVLTASARLSTPSQVLLKICPVTLRGENGREIDTYALFDEGSTITLVDEEIANAIGAEGPTRALRIHGITASQCEPASRTVAIQIRGRRQSEFQPVNARTVRNLALGTHAVDSSALKHRHLRRLKQDDVCHTGAKPQILIGADQWHLIVTRKLLTGKHNQPAASLTRLGWVIHGTAPRSILIQQEGEAVLHLRTSQSAQREDQDELIDLLKKHFEIDALGISRHKKPVATEERAKEIFKNTVKQSDGRYEVGLPWNRDDVTLPPSYNTARNRLRGIERKMDRSPQFKEAYTAQIERLLEKKYAVPCEEKTHDDPKLWYLPHFAVTNPNKPGKIRLVFDAAAKSNGVCLNDALLDGPDLLQTLHGVLFRFRDKPIAVTADIREMFLRVKIRREDQTAQHFLWRGEDRANPPRLYIMNSMIFGARSSPFLAHSVRNENARRHKESHPFAYEAITRNHYMDDWVDSFDSVEMAARAVKEVQEVHLKAGFELAGWNANRRCLLKDIPEVDKSHGPKELGAHAHEYEKTLGLLWEANSDELTFNTAMPRVPEDVRTGIRTPTKRESLGAVMSIFDPLGLLSPYTVTAKIMLQGLWTKKTGWDDPLPFEEAATFEDWQADLRFIRDLRIPRCYNSSGSERDRQLHVFCDASEQAYATSAYWRLTRNDDTVTVALVAGKAKVSPIKAQSMPRLELQACLIGARLATEIIKEHKSDAEVYLWSDSKTALHWIRNDSARYTPYVAHRLSEIAELTRVDQWRWVPTAHNAADDATRPGNTQLRRGDRWFIGPKFLYEGKEQWPQEAILPPPSEEELVVTHVREKTSLVDMARFATYERLVRTIAYVIAFTDKCRKRANQMGLTHIKRAELALIREAQRDTFADELRRLKKGRAVERTSRLYMLDPMYGTDQIIRLNGRINAASVPEEMKRPPILHSAHPLAKLLIKQAHEEHGHIGREQIVNNMRQHFWILRLRPAVRSVLRDCAFCRLKRAAPRKIIKGDLPRSRMQAYVRPFSHCGVDCFGPMWVTIGRRKEKRWGMLFTCLTTRAVHIELVASLSADSAIMAIRRMASRRGWPERMISDNGTNFHGADVELSKAYKEWLPALERYALKKRMEWRYTDPGAPNQGGAWERMIRSVKSALAITLNNRAPKEEILTTTLQEIEHTINSRPLTHVPVDPESPEALTPNHFLFGTAVGLPYVGECSVVDKQNWRVSQALSDIFWSRWVKEYLPTLSPRKDGRSHTDNVKEGDIVVIADGLLPRNTWPRGKIEKTYTGPDGMVRSAEVRTQGGVFRRPVRRLVVLPVEKGCEDLRRGETVEDDA